LNGYESYQSALVPNQLIFSGSFRYQANYEAMLWFISEVFPKILERVPDAQLIITGDHANLSIPPVSNVTLVGHVSDINTLIASSWVSLAPLLSGGGTRLKILEAMAGTPVVSTSKGRRVDAPQASIFLLQIHPVVCG
jgi:glycosyltransferase involved in cell wall biosynthesis